MAKTYELRKLALASMISVLASDFMDEHKDECDADAVETGCESIFEVSKSILKVVEYYEMHNEEDDFELNLMKEIIEASVKALARSMERMEEKADWDDLPQDVLEYISKEVGAPIEEIKKAGRFVCVNPKTGESISKEQARKLTIDNIKFGGEIDEDNIEEEIAKMMKEANKENN